MFEQMGRSEIAALVGDPPGTVASRLRRERSLLQRRLHEIGPAGGLQTTTAGLGDWMSSVRRVAGC